MRSNLCDYSVVHILVSGILTSDGKGDYDAAKLLHEKNKGVILINYVPFSECISNTNNTQIDNARDIYVVMPMYNISE